MTRQYRLRNSSPGQQIQPGKLNLCKPVNNKIFRVGLSCLPTCAVLVAVEAVRHAGGMVPTPFLLLLVAVGFSGYFGGRIAGSISGIIAAAFVLLSFTQGFGPASLTGTLPNALGGMALYAFSGMVLGRLRDERDVHYETLLETQRQNQEEPLKLASQLFGLGYYIWDTLGQRPIIVSDQHIRNYGVSREEFLEKVPHHGGDFALVHPDDREMLDRWWQQLEDGETVEMTYRVLGSEGSKWIRSIVGPIRNASGDIVKHVCASHDITAQKATEALLLEVQKMESIGHLSGGIAHDFNNILAVILGNLELLREDIENSDHIELIDAAIAASQRGAGLTRSMLSFARRARLQPQVLDLNAVVRQADKWMRRALPESIEVETVLHSRLWPVKLDPTALESALLNLLLNARDAMEGRGKVSIETANCCIDQALIDARGEKVPPGRYVMLAVSDTGTGIGTETLKHIFEPFYTTKAPGRGSGMGLPMIQGFIRQSNGALHVSTEVGVGTTVNLYFPISNTVLPNAAPLEGSQGPHGFGNCRILLVEDDEDVRSVLMAVLRNDGYDVAPAESGDAALDIFKADPNFDLVVSDIVMPGQLQGSGLARMIRMLNPEIPFIFMSGYAPEAEMNGKYLKSQDVRLMKPVLKAELLKAVSEVFERKN
ncbi:PAS domain-containing hybrid sensor histidine kinase/response regulator [Sagittula salina]|uniref:histidine kinase n=1 Tax=Sagittula salina TaxID=2820268 RepID=A0A940MNL4_9RHOB|nr:PAS domain-containing hybrid sensor histidine kinase/response regulator [Sagittula salina]MBP0485215.1 response regulator [Sagittula salina]